MRRPGKRIHWRFFSVLGPGFVTGAGDNDPSGIATYSIAGAQLGMSLLWTTFVTWPLMAFVQLMCARKGMVTGRGLAGRLRHSCPRWLLFSAGGGIARSECRHYRRPISPACQMQAKC
jgi:Mn2+/Fe2+ NRAMP family transporter